MADEPKSPAPPPAVKTAPAPTAAPTRASTPAEVGSANIQAVAQTGAPAVQTSGQREKIKALEAELRAEEDSNAARETRAKAVLRAQIAELKDREAREKGGLNDLTPMGNLLAVDSAVLAQYADDHLRWLNETVPGRAALARSKGYDRVPGQVEGGDMVLWKIKRDRWADGVAVKEAQTERLIRKASGSGQRDDVVHELQTFFDKNNVKIDANDLVLKERG